MTLKYWAEPETMYAVYELMEWEKDRNIVICEKKPSLGYLPVYETLEEARKAHPGRVYLEIKVIEEDIQ